MNKTIVYEFGGEILSTLHHFIELEYLDPRLTEKIPSNEEILYTSKCTVMKKGYGQGKTFGQIAITNKAIAFVCKKSGFSAGWASMKGNVDYIPFKDIVQFKNKKKMFYVKFQIPEDPTGKKKRGYNIWVERCKEEKEEVHKMSENPEILCECGFKMERGIIRNTTGFILKGNGWSGKDSKEKSYRLQKRREVGKKMVKKYDIPPILPNYKGEVCDSWSQAKSLAKKDGMNTQNYDKQVERLKKTQFETKEKVKRLSTGEDG